ncbi:MAG TPA: beta-galactosidase, partial [Terriglobales bacterium]|nr:beta-galactosidase [Terriglobales bacterium]
MKKFSRRDVLKTSVLASAAATVHGIAPIAAAMEIQPATAEPLFESPLQGTTDEATKSAGRERLLLDFGWRFHFGHADDSTKDFGFTGNFQKTGNFVPAGALAFDDSQWRELDLPHDWAIELPFQNDPALRSKGFYPLGKKYPATSVGWYRRTFDLSPEDKGKRITVEFDGAYRESMVV